MYADLNPGAHVLSDQMPCLLKASRSLSVVLAPLLQMDKMRLIEEKKKSNPDSLAFHWIFYCVNTHYLYIDIRFTEYSVWHQQNSQSKNNNTTGSHFPPCRPQTSGHPTSWVVISLETSTTHRSFLGQAIPFHHRLGFGSSSDRPTLWSPHLCPFTSDLPVQLSPFPLRLRQLVHNQVVWWPWVSSRQALGWRRCLCKITFRVILG